MKGDESSGFLPGSVTGYCFFLSSGFSSSPLVRPGRWPASFVTLGLSGLEDPQPVKKGLHRKQHKKANETVLRNMAVPLSSSIQVRVNDLATM